MTAHYEDGPVQIWHGDCIDVMRGMPDNSVDAVVTDPPYGLEFMGKEWDAPWETDPNVGKRWQTGMGEVTMADGATRLPRPSFEKNSNVKCRTCGKWRVSSNPCRCEKPDFPNVKAENMRAFQAWCEQWATEALRVLKPGGHLLAFGGTRTFHRLTAGIEDAGFEIRDSIAWLYGSGFPKSLDVSKAIDSRKDWGALHRLQAKVKAARVSLGISQSEAARRVGLIGPDETLGGGGFMWFETGMRVPTRDQYPALKLALGLDDECDQAFEAAEREVVGRYGSGITRGASGAGGGGEGGDRTAPATADAARWNGWGTALKPAFEPIVVARKPLTGTVAANVLAYGTGALNIDASRITATDSAAYAAKGASVVGLDSNRNRDAYGEWTGKRTDSTSQLGRWPANVVLDATQAAVLDAQSGPVGSNSGTPDKADGSKSALGLYAPGTTGSGRQWETRTGGASRFFYTAKASTDERPSVDGIAHPTVKPVDLMRWLVKLVTPPGGTVLEPFAGSGTTVEAAVLEGFHCIAIEREADYLPLILQRIRKPHAVGLDFGEWEA